MVQQSHTVLVDLRARDQIATVLRRLGPEGQRAARALESSGGRMSRALTSVGRTARGLTTTLFRPFTAFGRTLRRSVVPNVLALGAAFATVGGVSGATRGFLEFEGTLAEISTVADLTTSELQTLEQTVLDLAKAQGVNEAIVGRGLYQTISAGFGDAADAATLLTQATELSTAGLADSESAVRLLASSLNAYGKSADDAEQFSDALFQTVKLGVTTIPELAASLSNVTGTAAALNVPFEDLLAGVAALTKAGDPTSKAINNLRGALEALLRNGDAINDLFQDKLNRSFDENTVATEGLAETFNLLFEATDGSTAKLQELLGSSEALNAVLKLTGTGAETFADNIESMEDAAGATDEALQKIQSTLKFGLQQTLNAVRQGFEQALGREVATALSEIEARAGGLDSVLNQVEIVARALGGTVAIVVRRFGDLLGSFSEFIERAGGAPGVLRVVSASLEVVGAASSAAFETLVEGVNRAVDSLNIIPLKLRLVGFGFEELTSRLSTGQGLDEVLSENVDNILRLERQAEELRETLGSLLVTDSPDIANSSRSVLGELEDGAARLETIERRLEVLRERRDRQLARLNNRSEINRQVNEIEGAFQSARGGNLVTPETAERLRDALAALAAATEPDAQAAGEAVGDSFGLGLISQFGVQVAAGSETAAQGIIAFAMDAAQRLSEIDLFGGTSEQGTGIAQATEMDREALLRLSEDITNDLIPSYEELQAQIASTNMERLAEITRLRDLGLLSGEQAARLRQLAEQAMADQMEILATQRTLSDFEQIAADIGASVRNSLGDSIQGLIQGSIDGKEAFRQFAAQILSDLARIAVQRGILDNLFPSGGGGETSGGGGFLSRFLGGFFAGFEKGGIIKGGGGDFTPVRGYASGGPIFRSPHVALIGEGRQDEAVVPLPDGRRIPVQLQGGSGGANITLNISAVDGPSMGSYLRNGGSRDIIAAVREGLAGADYGLIDITRRVARG